LGPRKGGRNHAHINLGRRSCAPCLGSELTPRLPSGHHICISSLDLSKGEITTIQFKDLDWLDFQS
jgi:hypothetical protein